MARRASKQQVVVKASLGTCHQCAHHYGEHELTVSEPRRYFMCKCPFEKWSQFLSSRVSMANSNNGNSLL